MKTVAKILVVMAVVMGLGIFYFIVKYFFLGDFSLEKKILATVIASIVLIPLVGRLIVVGKDKQ
jgi:hypothetical protein